jgi:hypothetical protein
MAVGLSWFYIPNDDSYLTFGAAVHHLNEPNQSFLEDKSDVLYRKYVFHGGLQFKLAGNVLLLPSFLYLNQGPHNEVNFGSFLKFRLTDYASSSEIAFYWGAWWRVADAVVATARVDIKDIFISFGYDINLSKLSVASNGRGGPELSLVYILNRKRASRPVQSNAILCPKF